MTNGINSRSALAASLLIAFGCIAASIATAGDKKSSPVQFANSCAAGVQAKFNHAVALLHSFEYPETTRLFSEIIEKDPSCAMAYWGSAMSIWHPLWAPPSKADLEKGAALLAIAAQLKATPREAAFIDALSTFFSSNDVATHRERAKQHELGMHAVYENNLDDPEAAVFYALALLASADPRDKSYAHQFTAAGLLNWVRAAKPTHPGVFHYLIHSYDYPGLAHLALDAATAYAGAAPNSSHAQHMPSHIFTRLGLWERSLASNHDSIRSAAAYTLSAHLPGHYDEGLHSIDYLMYAMLQTGRDDEARELLVTLGNIKKTDAESFKVAFTYAASPARYALERRMWAEASELELVREDFAWDDFPWAQSIHFFARGIGSARSGQIAKAKEELATIEGLLANMATSTPAYFRTQTQVHVASVTAWILLAEGDEEQALALAASAADSEDAVDKHPVTPGEVLPARELYADMLFAAGRDAQGLAQYQRVLGAAPYRLNALLGAANAAARLDQPELAKVYRAVVREQTRSGSGRRQPTS